MAIAIQTNLGNQIRAYAEAHPSAAPQEIARQFGVPVSRVNNALSHPGKRRPPKSVTG